MPVTWANGVNGMLTEAEWLTFEPRIARPNEPIDQLFKDEQSDNLKARWASIAQMQLVPKMAKYRAFDAESNKTFRPTLENHEIEKGLIAVKINTSETLLELMQMGETIPDRLRDAVFNDALNLAEQVKTRTIVAKYEVMATGQVTIGENNLDIKIPFGVGDNQKGFKIDLASTTNPFAVIQDIINAAKAKGVVINGLMTQSKNLTKMRQNAKVQTAINGNAASDATVKKSTFEDYLASEFGITTIVEADGIYNPDNEALNGSSSTAEIKTLYYYPDNKITFFATMPNGKVGAGLWGVPPAVLNKLITTRTSSNGRFIYINQWTENDADVLWTRASAVFIPILVNPDSLWIADVIDSGV